MAKRGRPIGATSWSRNPNNRAAHFATALIEFWLAGVGESAVRRMLSSLAGNSELQILITECWRNRGNERRYTVPPKIKRNLCQLAIAHDTALRRAFLQDVRLAAGKSRLQSAGFSDAQIAVKLSHLEREPIHLESPSLKRVMEKVTRRAPAGTLRRKATARKSRK